MKAPPLPEVFGNYALGEGFAEVASASAIDWWPQTAGWLLVVVAVGVFLLRASYRRLRHWYANRYRREALAALEELRSGPGDKLPAALSDLLKRSALAAFPRREVAGLYGEAWVGFLNRHCDQPLFVGSSARALSLDQYEIGRAAPLSSGEQEALLCACRQWLQQHRGPADA